MWNLHPRFRRKSMKNLVAALLVIGTAVSVHASEYGCTVLLCLSNPASNGGPKVVSQCVDPISQLYDDLRHGRPFPKCDLADGNDGSSYARHVYDPYDPCPYPLQPAMQGLYVVQGQRKINAANTDGFGGSDGYVLSGQPQLSEQVSDVGTVGMRACIGQIVGSYNVGNQDDGYVVNVVDKVIWQQAQPPRAIDIYMNRKWYQRVRW
jgi:hypothetical protein